MFNLLFSSNVNEGNVKNLDLLTSKLTFSGACCLSILLVCGLIHPKTPAGLQELFNRLPMMFLVSSVCSC